MVPPLTGRDRPAYAQQGGTYYHSDETLQRVLECLAAGKMSNAEVARRFGMSASYVSHLRTGKAARIAKIRSQKDTKEPPALPNGWSQEKPASQYTDEELAELERMEREEAEQGKAAQ